MVKITITGHPYVKKSNQKVRRSPRTGKYVKYNTVSYTRWHTSALEQLEALGYNPKFKSMQKEFGTEAIINYPINLQCNFYMSTDGRVDLSALYEGIQDVLVEVGILEDDNFHIVASHDGSSVQKDADNPRMEITITPKRITK